jgi:hypothetical protein
MEENRKRYIERKMKEQRKEKGNSDAMKVMCASGEDLG